MVSQVPALDLYIRGSRDEDEFNITIIRACLST